MALAQQFPNLARQGRRTGGGWNCGLTSAAAAGKRQAWQWWWKTKTDRHKHRDRWKISDRQQQEWLTWQTAAEPGRSDSAHWAGDQLPIGLCCLLPVSSSLGPLGIHPSSSLSPIKAFSSLLISPSLSPLGDLACGKSMSLGVSQINMCRFGGLFKCSQTWASPNFFHFSIFVYVSHACLCCGTVCHSLVLFRHFIQLYMGMSSLLCHVMPVSIIIIFKPCVVCGLIFLTCKQYVCVCVYERREGIGTFWEQFFISMTEFSGGVLDSFSLSFSLCV